MEAQEMSPFANQFTGKLQRIMLSTPRTYYSPNNPYIPRKKIEWEENDRSGMCWISN